MARCIYPNPDLEILKHFHLPYFPSLAKPSLLFPLFGKALSLISPLWQRGVRGDFIGEEDLLCEQLSISVFEYGIYINISVLLTYDC